MRHEVVKQIETEAKEHNKKYTDKEIKEKVKRKMEAITAQASGNEVPGTDTFRMKHSLNFLDDPVDKCMIKALFR